MGKPGRGQAQQTVQIQLPGRGGEQVRPPHHLRHPHPGVVHDDGQLVSKDPIGPAEVEIPAVPQQVLAVGAHAAVHERNFFVRHAETISRGFCFALFGNLGGRQVPAGAGVDHIAVRGVGGAGSVQLGPGAKAGVDKALLLQLGIGLLIDGRALALVIGNVGPAGGAALVPHKAQPFQVFFQQVRKLAGTALRVEIFNAEDDPAPLAFGAEPGQQAASQVAQMEPPAGAGGKPPDRPAHRPSFHSPSFGWKMGVL